MAAESKNGEPVTYIPKTVTQARVMYTKEQKISAVKLLRDSNYDYTQVSKTLGIRAGTLRQWNLRYKNLEVPTSTQLIAAKVELDLEQMRKEFITSHFSSLDELAQKAVNRALELVEVEEDLNKVNNTIKILTDFFAKMQNTANDTDKPGSAVTVNLIQQSIQMLNNR